MDERAPLDRPECFEFAMDFLGDPEESEVRAYVEALEERVGGAVHDDLRRRLAVVEKRLTALEPTTTPQPQPEPPAVGVSVEELADIMCDVGVTGWSSLAKEFASSLLAHHRTGPLLRGEGRRRVELPEEPPVWLMRDVRGRPWETREVNGLIRDAWAVARAELARQQEVG